MLPDVLLQLVQAHAATSGEDSILGAAFHGFPDTTAHLTPQGANSILDLGAGHMVTFDSAQASALSAADFVFC